MNNDLISKAKLFNLLANVWTLEDAYSTIQDMPTEEAEKVIRCMDCKHWKNQHLCESLSRFGSFETKADFYCGYAERK